MATGNPCFDEVLVNDGGAARHVRRPCSSDAPLHSKGAATMAEAGELMQLGETPAGDLSYAGDPLFGYPKLQNGGSFLGSLNYMAFGL